MEIVFFIIIIAALSLYGLGKKCSMATDNVGCVEAGATDSACAEELSQLSHREKRKIIYDSNNHPIDTKDYLRVVVSGNCLSPTGITNRSQLLVYRFKDENEKSEIKSGDILMIHLKSKNIDKVRVFDRMRDDGKMDTYRYSDNGEKIMSSRPHDLQSVVGVVKYLL